MRSGEIERGLRERAPDPATTLARFDPMS